MLRRNAAKALLLVAALVPLGVAVAKTTDRNQQMQSSSDTADCSVNEGPCLLIGNVRILQGTLDINAAKADVRRGGDGEVNTVKLTGSPVVMKQQSDDGGWINATAAQIDYDIPDDTVVLTGGAKVDQPGKGSVSGGRIVYNTRTGQVQSGGESGGGRVNMTFEPKNKGAQPAKPPAAPAAQDKK